MRVCPKCRLSGDDKAFFPKYTNQKWCRSCVDKRVKSRKQSLDGSNLEREQKAIRDLIRQLQVKGQSYVYLIEGPLGYKIGFSKDVARRAEQLNTALGWTCSIIAMAPGNKELESSLHTRHRLKRINREWFEKHTQILRDFASLPERFVFLNEYLVSEGSGEPPASVEIRKP